MDALRAGQLAITRIKISLFLDFHLSPSKSLNFEAE